MKSDRRLRNEVTLDMVLAKEYGNATALLSWLVSTDRVCTEYLMLLEVGTATQLRKLCVALDGLTDWSSAKQLVQGLVLKLQPKLQDYDWYERRLLALR